MVAQFIADEGVLRGYILTLEQGSEWTLGRDPESCQLVIEDPKVSRQHAICRQADEGILIENLSRTNPTLVNGMPIPTSTLLHEGDMVKIGSTIFRFTLKASSPQAAAAPDFLKEGLNERLESNDTIFQEAAPQNTLSPPIDLKITSRFVLKVIAGPQSGAEFSMETGEQYVIGNDPSGCDIVVYDLSVSKQHARISTTEEGPFIEDLKSRNGTVIDGKIIDQKTHLKSGQIISLGTTSFVIIDREQTSDTIFAQPVQKPEPEEKFTEETPSPASEVSSQEEAVILSERSSLTTGGLILSFIILGVCAIIAVGTWKLFNGREAFVEQKDYSSEITTALAPFPDVSYTYNKNTGTLFLVGHVLTQTDKNQLLYNLQGLNFISHTDDNNVVIDQLVWQEMNTLIAKNPAWNGINMYAVKPGLFVLTGYLKTNQEQGLLSDYINRNFPYLDRLENKVIVEEDLIAKIQGDLFSHGLNNVNAQVINGELTLTGFVGTNQLTAYQQLMKQWKATPGIRMIKNFVAALAPQEAITNLSDRYTVSGSTKSDDVNINVVINGRILGRGDTLDGMTITSIQPDTIYLEKDGLKFKINYNPQ